MHYFVKVLLFVASVLLVFTYIGYSVPSQPSLPPEAEGAIDFSAIETQDELVMVGQNLFFGKGQCALCHAIGHSEMARCPSLEKIGAKLTYDFLYETLTDPQAFVFMQYQYSPPKDFGAQMPRIDKDPIGLSENEIRAVIAFIQSTGGREYVTVEPSDLVRPVTATLSTGDADRGARIYDALECAGCHEASTAEGPDLSSVMKLQDPLYLMGAIQGGSSHQGFDERLTLQALNDLMAYLTRGQENSHPL